MKEIYLKLTEDEVEDVISALHTQNDVYGSNSLGHDPTPTNELIAKIFMQKDPTVCRPYVVSGTHEVDMLRLPVKLVVMAEEPRWAIEYAQEHIEKNQGGRFIVNTESVHELADDEFVEVRE
jgi:hypothetical protein